MKLKIIVGSIRPTRQTIKLAKWTFKEAQKRPELEVELLDLKDYSLPFFDEAISPKYNPDRQLNGTLKAWLDKLATGEAYLFVTPEYNHSLPGTLKNAIDYIGWQVAKKPIAIAAHGSTGGAFAIEHFKNIISEIQAIPIPTNLAWTHRVGETFDDEGNLTEQYRGEEGPEAKFNASLDELIWYAKALSAARRQDK